MRRPSCKRFTDNAAKLHILEEQGDCCAYCGSELNALNPAYFDHFIPVAAGGNKHISNMFASCRDCNQGKADKIFRSFEECRQYLYERRKARKRVRDWSALAE